jgi:DNA-binding transcriptional ArsR family regulator
MTPNELRLTDLDALGQAAECLRTLAHPHRLRIVQMLLHGQYTVGQLAEACEIPSPMTSEHLRLMLLSPVENGGASRWKIRVKMAAHMRAVR